METTSPKLTQPNSRQKSSDLPSRLTKALELISQLGTNYSSDHQKLQALNKRWQEERFHLAVLGQFKRGKSTLLNALLGKSLLPTSVIPLTAIPSYLLPDSQLQIRVFFNDEKPPETITFEEIQEMNKALTSFVTEEGNPHNRQNVAYVEIYHPASILKRGVVLIDTPGIGSAYRHNTEATLNFLPQCDAALFLVSADPPLTEVEIEFLKNVRTKVPKLFFILNKVDYLDSTELKTALDFLKKMLREQIGLENPEPIFSLSARQGLQAQQENNQELWEKSGLAALEDHLLHFLVSDKTRVLQKAVSKRVTDLLVEILLRVQLTIRSLQMPINDLDARQLLFEQKITETEQQRLVAQDLLTGNHKRMVALLEEQAEFLRQRARRHFRQVVHLMLEEMGNSLPDEKLLENALAECIPVFFERELGEVARSFEQSVRSTLSSHQLRADALVEEIRRAAAEVFEVTYHPLDSGNSFTYDRQPYWITHHWHTSLNPFTPQMIDHFLPRNWQKARRLKRLDEQIDILVTVNVESLRWATLQSLNKTFRRFRSALEERFTETTAAAQGAIKAARQFRMEKSGTIQDSILNLEKQAKRLEILQSEFHN